MTWFGSTYYTSVCSSDVFCVLPLQLDFKSSCGSWSDLEAAELQINPQYREIKKLKPVLRRLLPARTQFAQIEELFNCDVEGESRANSGSNPMGMETAGTATTSTVGPTDSTEDITTDLDVIGEESGCDEDEGSDEDCYDRHSYAAALDAIGEDVSEDDDSVDIADIAGSVGDEDFPQYTGHSSAQSNPIYPQVHPSHDASPGGGQLLSMEEEEGGSRRKGRNDSGFLMGNPMTSPRPSEGEGTSPPSPPWPGAERDSTSSNASAASTNSIDRLPRGVHVFRKASLDIFQSKRK